MEITLERNKTYNSISHKLMVIITLISYVIYITPLLSTEVPKSIWVILVLFSYLLSLNDLFRKGTYNKKIICLSAIWILFIVFYYIIGFSSAAVGNYFLILVSFDIIFKSIYIKNVFSPKEKKFVFTVIEIIILFLTIYNLYTWVLEPSSFDNFTFYPDKYLGTNKIYSSHSYIFLAYFSNWCLFNFFRNSKGAFKIIDLAVFLSCVVVLFLINPRMNAIIIFLLFFVFNILNISKKKTYKLLAVFILIIALAVLLIYSDYIRSLLPERLAVRLDSLLSLFHGNGYSYDEGSLESRFTLSLNSLKTFVSSFRNFIFGVGWHLGSQYYDLIGQHNLILDNFAFYGVFSLLFIYIFFVLYRKEYVKEGKSVYWNNYLNFSFYSFLLLSLISNHFYPDPMIAIFIMPSLLIKE